MVCMLVENSSYFRSVFSWSGSQMKYSLKLYLLYTVLLSKTWFKNVSYWAFHSVVYFRSLWNKFYKIHYSDHELSYINSTYADLAYIFRQASLYRQSQTENLIRRTYSQSFNLKVSSIDSTLWNYDVKQKSIELCFKNSSTCIVRCKVWRLLKVYKI